MLVNNISETMIRATAISLFLALLSLESQAFTVVGPAKTSQTVLQATTGDSEGSTVDRRGLFQAAAAATIGISAFSFPNVLPANAEGTSKVVLAGATGQTGRRILERLAAKPG